MGAVDSQCRLCWGGHDRVGFPVPGDMRVLEQGRPREQGCAVEAEALAGFVEMSLPVGVEFRFQHFQPCLLLSVFGQPSGLGNAIEQILHFLVCELDPDISPFVNSCPLNEVSVFAQVLLQDSEFSFRDGDLRTLRFSSRHGITLQERYQRQSS